MIRIICIGGVLFLLFSDQVTKSSGLVDIDDDGMKRHSSKHVVSPGSGEHDDTTKFLDQC